MALSIIYFVSSLLLIGIIKSSFKKYLANIIYEMKIKILTLALKLAYGLINADDPLLKNNDTDSPIGIDNKWVHNLAKQLILRRDNSKCLCRSLHRFR